MDRGRIVYVRNGAEADKRKRAQQASFYATMDGWMDAAAADATGVVGIHPYMADKGNP